MSIWNFIFGGVSGLSIIMLVVFLIKLGGFIQRFEAVEKKEAECPINDVKTELKVLIGQFKMYLQSVSSNMADAIREHRMVKIDTLLDKMNWGTATFDELNELATLLRNDMIETRSDEGDAKAHRIGMASLLAVVNVQICARAEVAP